jgi:hypothetical protein
VLLILKTPRNPENVKVNAFSTQTTPGFSSQLAWNNQAIETLLP